MKTILLSFALMSLCTAAIAQKEVDNSTITAFNLDNYLGKWYEIARYDHSFERDLVGSTAVYTLRDDGKIKVLNTLNVWSCNPSALRFYESMGLVPQKICMEQIL